METSLNDGCWARGEWGRSSREGQEGELGEGDEDEGEVVVMEGRDRTLEGRGRIWGFKMLFLGAGIEVLVVVIAVRHDESIPVEEAARVIVFDEVDKTSGWTGRSGVVEDLT